MKKVFIAGVIFVFILCVANVIQGQTTQPQLNQVELMKNFLGTWQANTGIDTIEVWEGQLYGKALITTVSQIIKGKKSPLYTNNMGFDSRDGNLRGFILFTNTDCYTWIGKFTTENKFSVKMVDLNNSQDIYNKYEFEFKPPAEMIMKGYDANGVKFEDLNFKKVK